MNPVRDLTTAQYKVHMTREQIRTCATALNDTVELYEDIVRKGEGSVEELDKLESARNVMCQGYRDALLSEVTRYKSFTDKEIAEYRDEAEHQEGYVYWLVFPGFEELTEDMRRYFAAKG